MWDRIGSGRAVRLACLAALTALAAPGRADAARLRGTVVDREGKPAAGAKVWAAKLAGWQPLETREATADGSGAFSIEAGPGDWGVFALRGDEGGRVGWDSIPKVEEGDDPAPVTVRLRPPAKLKGRLIDAGTGKPIAGGRFALDDARRLEVDSNGRFEAPGLEPTHHEAYPLCPGYERRRVLFDTTGRPDAALELKLPKAGKVVGRVVDEHGKPIPGATVGLRNSGSIFSGAALWEKCSDDGRYSYDGRPPGLSGHLSAHAPGYQDHDRQDVAVPDAPEPAEIDFTLRPDPNASGARGPGAKAAAGAMNRRAVSGVVVGPGGKPAASAVVRWGLLVSSNGVPETKTDSRGAFRLEGVPDAFDVLSVMAKGLAPSFPAVDAGADPQVHVQLKAGATIRGRVVDDSGEPVEGVRVYPRVSNPRPNAAGFVTLDVLQTTTDRDGRFVLKGMPEGVAGDFVGEARSAVRGRALSPSDESKNVVTLLGGGAVRGRVVDPSGKPVRNFRVQVGIPEGSKPGDPVGGYFAGYASPGLSFTRDDGEFTLSGLTAGNLHLITVIAEGFGAGEADRVEARPVNRLKPAEALTIELALPHTLRVFVFREGGKPVEGARVTLVQSKGRGVFHWGVSESSWVDSVTARVDPKGWAEFPALAFRKGTVVVRARGFSRKKLDWAKDEEEFSVDLEPEAKLAGAVLDEAGKPINGARVTLIWGAGEMMNVTVDERDGRFLVEGLGAGKYTLNVFPAGGGARRASESIELEPGKTLTLDVRVKTPKPGAAAGR